MFRGVHSNYIIVVHGASHIYMELNSNAAVSIVCGNSLKQYFNTLSISLEDDIQKVLDGEDEEGSNAREYYGNWSEEDLLDEQSRLQLGIIEECFETFMERVK